MTTSWAASVERLEVQDAQAAVASRERSIGEAVWGKRKNPLKTQPDLLPVAEVRRLQKNSRRELDPMMLADLLQRQILVDNCSAESCGCEEISSPVSFKVRMVTRGQRHFDR